MRSLLINIMHTTGHTVLITGGASGIGFALAEKFHAAGNRVIVVGRNQDALAKAAAALPGIITRVADISLAEDRQQLVTEFSDISILVNNAGVQYNLPLGESSDHEIEYELNVNFLAPVLLSRAFLPHLQEREESAIINVSSGLAIVPKQVAAIYCASKSAMHSFSKTLRWQLEGSPVRVFEILPPLVDTAMTAGRGKGKISPAELAREFWEGFQADKYEMLIGKTKLLYFLNRLLPSVAVKIMRPGL